MAANIKIERPLYDKEGLHEALEYSHPKSKFCSNLLARCNTFKPNKCFLKTIPVLRWLPEYKWKTDLVNDLIAGFTVAIMHIPQGMAYALLGNVPPVIGIYMAFFPVLVYFFLGTSRHNSMGTFAIVCLMTGKVVLEKSHIAQPSAEMLIANGTTTPTSTVLTELSPVEVATAVTFVVGVCQLIMYMFRLGILTTLLSETLVSGFVTGSAVTVLISQIKDLFGVSIPQHKGYFTNIKILISLFQEIQNLNVIATIISVVAIVVCVINNEFLKPRVSKVSIFPIPIELIVVVSGTLVSYFCKLNSVYGVKILGDIPSGLPPPALPNFTVVSSVIMDGLVISIIAYSISLSMAFIFAQKNGYEVDPNQELLAQGASNIFGSFFLCMPISTSLSRSLIQYTVGGKTQLSSLVSCFILLFVLLWIGPYFEELPKAILASVIVVALKGMLMQVLDFLRFWKLSKADAGVWMLTFLTVVIVSVDIGLLVGVIVSLLTVLLQGIKPYTCLLGSVPDTDFYVDINRYKKAKEVAEIKIFHYCGGINFVTKNYFRGELYRLTEVNPQKALVKKLKAEKNNKLKGIDNVTFNSNEYTVTEVFRNGDGAIAKESSLKFIILDFSALSYIDPSAISALQIIIEDYKKVDISIIISGCPDPVYELMKKCDMIENSEIKIYPTVHDAVQSTVSSVVTAL